jgi:hypothetical protein
MPNYVLGRGKLYFDQFLPGTTTKTGELYLGNSPALSLTSESETLDHFNSDEGINVKDDSVTLQTNRTGSFTLDDISMPNIALFFNASLAAVAQSSGTATDELVSTGFKLDGYYQLGVPTNPAGVRGVSAVTVKAGATAGAAVTLTLGTDYELDATLARVHILPGSGANVAHNLYVTYTRAANTREQGTVNSGATVEGALRFIAINAKGINRDYYFPKVTVSPNGDFSLKGDDWQQLPFNLEILKLNDATASMYIDGRAA